LSDLPGPGRAADLAAQPVATRDEILGLIAAPLDAVEISFRAQLASPVAIIDEIGGFVADGGGKRVRPTLHLLAARLCDYAGPHDVLLATVLEFIHCATLIHDDIIDGAAMRRGRASVNRRWDNNVTVLFGDYLFAKAMELALRAGSLEIMERLADVTLRMTEGEMIQTRFVGRLDVSVDEYLDLVDKKTAALFACCCELGGVLGAVGPGRLAALAAYGSNLGLAFQLVDDLLDFTGNAERLGKPAASDLREGKATLAVLDLIATGDVEARRLAEAVIRGGASGAPEIPRLTDLIRDSGALARTQHRAAALAERAAGALAVFDDSPARRAMLALTDLLVNRDH